VKVRTKKNIELLDKRIATYLKPKINLKEYIMSRGNPNDKPDRIKCRDWQRQINEKIPEQSRLQNEWSTVSGKIRKLGRKKNLTSEETENLRNLKSREGKLFRDLKIVGATIIGLEQLMDTEGCNISENHSSSENLSDGSKKSTILPALSSYRTSDLRLKSPKDWTEDELKDAMKERESASNDAEKREMFEANYGNGEAGFDETGRMMQPKPIRSIPSTPVPVRTNDGQDLENAMRDIWDRLPKKDKNGDPIVGIPEGPVDDGFPDDGFVGIPEFKNPDRGYPGEIPDIQMVKGIQSGLNMLSNKKNQSPLPGKQMTVKLKEDGLVGPKTSFGLKKALVNNGSPKVSEAIALGQFKETMKKAKAAGPQNLASELGAVFAPLLGSKKTPKEGFQPEGLALQDTLNDLGASKKGYELLKDDGIVGPKTEAAFDLVAKSTDEDELINQFGYNLGFDF